MPAATQKGLAPVKYVIDPAASRFTVQAFATGMLSTSAITPPSAFAILKVKWASFLRAMSRLMFE
jgi:hypothetical protein